MVSPPPAVPTATRRLLDTLLGGVVEGGLDEYVREQRSRGVSWRLVARDLYEATGVDVTEQTLRSWYPEPRDEES